MTGAAFLAAAAAMAVAAFLALAMAGAPAAGDPLAQADDSKPCAVRYCALVIF
ncbi:MAG: hypothetical protein RIE56_10165 [Amphiplicatus sp.]